MESKCQFHRNGIPCSGKPKLINVKNYQTLISNFCFFDFSFVKRSDSRVFDYAAILAISYSMYHWIEES